jgi:hypothetical protein
MLTSMDPSNVSEVQPVETLETPILMTTYFIEQQIDMGIHDTKHEVSKQLVDVLKFMVQNEFQETKDLEVVRDNYGDSSVTKIP